MNSMLPYKTNLFDYMNRWKSWLGFVRSYMIYLGNPLKKGKLKEFYQAWLKPGDLCFDIGAHMGIQSQIWSSMGVKSIAVEPNPVLYNFLKRRFRNRPNIQVLCLAISDQEGEEILHISSMAPTVSTLSDNSFKEDIRANSSFNVRWDKRIQVKTTTLDRLIEKFGLPKLVKLDIEDYELQALKGLHQSVPLITFEFFSYRPQQVINCIEEIEKNGIYEYNFSIAETFKLQLSVWKSASEMKDWITNRSPEEGHGDIIARFLEKK